MAHPVLYLDASALVKLVREERETEALRDRIRQFPELVTSVVGAIEVRRAAARGGSTDLAESLVAELALVELDREVRSLAGTVGSPTLRSLGAIHLATALSLGADLGAFCCYDQRLRADAEAAGLNVLSPGLGGIGGT